MLEAKRTYLIWFCVHFVLIVAVCGKETFWLVAQRLTLAPHSFTRWCRKAEDRLAAVRWSNASVRLAEIGVSTYLHCSGTESGYGYFAPHVTNSCQLIFELSYPDGHIEYDVPGVGSDAAGLRVASLLDKLSRSNLDPVREPMIRMLTYSVWQEHPRATKVRSILISVGLPTVEQFERGEKGSREILYSYEYAWTKRLVEPP